jgi:DNA-binding CsgD family transcriptional regulator
MLPQQSHIVYRLYLMFYDKNKIIRYEYPFEGATLLLVFKLIIQAFMNQRFRDRYREAYICSVQLCRNGEHDELPRYRPVFLERCNQFGLTMTEREVLYYKSTGLSDDEVSKRLNISVRTVTTHLVNIYAKLEVGSCREALNKVTN